MDTKQRHPRSAIPLFLQIVSAMRQRIEAGIWAPGSRIPSLEELADEFSVARATVRQAVSELEAEGLIWRKQGRGTFVNEDVKLNNKRWLNLQADWKQIVQTGKNLKVTILEASENAALPHLPPEEGQPVESYHFMKRLHTRKGQSYCVANIYLDSTIYQQNPAGFDQRTVVSVLDTSPHIQIARARQTITIGSADIENARLLEIAINAPVAHLRRIACGANDALVYLVDAVYPADIVKIDMQLK